ncbi:hypothetical protein ACJIZ3_017385 [Penstemon smallii]|uniref:Germin-like protein n=1 Tax=Penstemon smallii TaxID=265156 RepID=A0ABD3SWJ0_9LAMI
MAARQNAFSCFFLLVLCVSACKGKDWCLTNFDTPPRIMQYYIDTYCGSSVDCGPIQYRGPCFFPDTLRGHSSWVANEYYRKFGSCPQEIGELIGVDPSISLSSSWIVRASDPDILSDFIVPPNSTVPDGNFFTFTGMRGILGSTIPNFKVTKASKAEFPSLDGQSVSLAILQYPSGGSVNPLHIHPRASELLFVLEGSLEVGFVDTTGKLFTQTLQLGDMFVFPKGLVHYQYNADLKQPATAVSAFGSASAGTVSLPTTLFATNVDDVVLARSFKTDVGTIQKLKGGFGSIK